MNAVIATCLHARRLEAYLAPEPVDEQTNEKKRTYNQTGRQSGDQLNGAGEGTQNPTPNTKRETRAQIISLIESIGKAWERNGKAMKELEAHCEKAGTPIGLGLADEMKPTILKTAGVIEESILVKKRQLDAEEPKPAQSEAKNERKD